MEKTPCTIESEGSGQAAPSKSSSCLYQQALGCEMPTQCHSCAIQHRPFIKVSVWLRRNTGTIQIFCDMAWRQPPDHNLAKATDSETPTEGGVGRLRAKVDHPQRPLASEPIRSRSLRADCLYTAVSGRKQGIKRDFTTQYQRPYIWFTMAHRILDEYLDIEKLAGRVSSGA